MFNIYYFKRLNSTNNKAKNFKENSVIIADEQIKGKGRFKRKWSSGKGGIYLSIVLGIDDFNLQYLTFIAVISAHKAIKECYGSNTIIKWPNDLIYNNKKLCGILTETKEKKAIVGIGVNTNNIIPKSLRDKAISLNNIIGKKADNKKIIKTLLEYFEGYYSKLINRRYNEIINDWKRNSFLGSTIRVKTLGKTYSGIAFDVDKDCFLIVKDRKGKKMIIKEGDVLVE